MQIKAFNSLNKIIKKSKTEIIFEFGQYIAVSELVKDELFNKTERVLFVNNLTVIM